MSWGSGAGLIEFYEEQWIGKEFGALRGTPRCTKKRTLCLCVDFILITCSGLQKSLCVGKPWQEKGDELGGGSGSGSRGERVRNG